MQGFPKRLYLLDFSRGLAALAVVFSHWKHFYVGISSSAEDTPLYFLFSMLFDSGGVAVDYFFCLSGFVFYWKYQAGIRSGEVSTWRFFVARFSRLYPLHLATLLLVCLLQHYYWVLNGSYFVYQFNDIKHFILNLFFASQWGMEHGFSYNGPIWSVSVEILLYVFFFLSVKYGRFRLCLPMLCALVTFILCRKLGLSHGLTKGLMLFNLGGVVFGLVRIVRERFKATACLSLAIGLLVFFLSGYVCTIYLEEVLRTFGSSGLISKGHYILLTQFVWVFGLIPATVFFLTNVELSTGWTAKRIAWVGDITYSSYLLHFPLQLVAVLLVGVGILPEEFYMSVYGLVGFFVVLIYISRLSYRKFELPAQSILRASMIRKETTKC